MTGPIALAGWGEVMVVAAVRRDGTRKDVDTAFWRKERRDGAVGVAAEVTVTGFLTMDCLLLGVE